MGHAQLLTNTHITNKPPHKLRHKVSALVFVRHAVVCARSPGPNDTGACPPTRDVPGLGYPPAETGRPYRVVNRRRCAYATGRGYPMAHHGAQPERWLQLACGVAAFQSAAAHFWQ